MEQNEITDLLEKKMNSGREYRRIEAFEVRAAEDSTEESYIVEGYATKFDARYTLWSYDDYQFDEQIDAHAFDECDMDDVIMQYDHEGRVFARTRNNTLAVTADAVGLHIRADLGGTEIGRQLYEEIKGGYTDKMSFGFVVSEDERTITENHDIGKTIVLRTITKIRKLYDVSAVSIPANDATEISARKLCDGVVAELREEVAKAEKIKAQRAKIRLLCDL